MPRLLGLLLLLQVAGASAGPAAERLAEALRFPTISHQDSQQLDANAFLGLHAFLRESYPRVFANLEAEIINDYSLLLIWPGSEPQRRPVLFTAHLDVVPIEPGTEAGWQHPPFAGVIADGFIYGRGALDDKIGVISLLEAAESLLAEGFTPDRSIVFGFGHDEEVGGRAGAARIAARLVERGLYFDWMVDEGSYIISDNPLLPGRTVTLIGVAEKAYLTLILRSRGEGGHSSTPPAQTPIGQLAAAVARVEANPLPAKIVPPVDAMFEAAAPHVEFPNSFVFSNLWLTRSLLAHRLAEDPLMGSFVRTTTAVTVFQAGVKDNVIPQLAEARINFRLLPGDTPEQVISHVRSVINDPGIEIDRARDWNDPPPVAAMEGGGYAVIEKAAHSVYGDAVAIPYMMSATTDVRHYVDLADDHYRFHGAIISVTQTPGIHGTNERVGVDSFENAVRIAREMLLLGGREGL